MSIEERLRDFAKTHLPSAGRCRWCGELAFGAPTVDAYFCVWCQGWTTQLEELAGPECWEKVRASGYALAETLRRCA